MESLAHLSEAQRLALDKLTALIGVEQVDHIAEKRQGNRDASKI